MKNFIELPLGNYVVSHGYDYNNKEIEESHTVSVFSKKVVAVSRIKPLREKYILTDYVDGRWI